MPSLLHSNNSLVSEVVKLRKKYASAMREKEKLLIEVSRLRLLEVKHREFMNIFEPLSSSLLSQLDGLAVFRSKVKDVVKLGRECEVPKENKPVDQSGSPMKTMAVSPMINGHLLKKASISLQRVNLMAQGTSNRGRGEVQWHREEHRTLQRNIESSSLMPISEHSSSSSSSPSFSQEAYQLRFNPVVPLQRLSLNQQNVLSSTSHETRLLQEEINTRIPVVRLQSLSLQSVPSEQENQSVLQSQAMVLLDRLHISSVTDSVNSIENSPVSIPERTTQIPNNEDVSEEAIVVTQEFTETNGAIFSNCCSTSVLRAETSQPIELIPEPQPFSSGHLLNSPEQTSSSENTQELTNSVSRSSMSVDETIMRCEAITDSSANSSFGVRIPMSDTLSQGDESTSETSPSLTRTYLDLEQTMGVLSFGRIDDHVGQFHWSHLQTTSCSAEEHVPSTVPVVEPLTVPVVEPLTVPENEESHHPPFNIEAEMSSSNTVNENQVTGENDQCVTPIIHRARRRCTLNVNYKLTPCNKKKRRE